jgi:hypothetical protein
MDPVGDLFDAWQHRTMPHIERALSALRARHFLFTWHRYVLDVAEEVNEVYDTSFVSPIKNFLSGATFGTLLCICENLLALIICHRDIYPTVPLCPHLHGSEACEHSFAATRQVDPNCTYSGHLGTQRHAMARDFAISSGIKVKAEKTSRTGYLESMATIDSILSPEHIAILTTYPTNPQLNSIADTAAEEVVALWKLVKVDASADLSPAQVLEWTTKAFLGADADKGDDMWDWEEEGQGRSAESEMEKDGDDADREPEPAPEVSAVAGGKDADLGYSALGESDESAGFTISQSIAYSAKLVHDAAVNEEAYVALEDEITFAAGRAPERAPFSLRALLNPVTEGVPAVAAGSLHSKFLDPSRKFINLPALLSSRTNNQYHSRVHSEKEKPAPVAPNASFTYNNVTRKTALLHEDSSYLHGGSDFQKARVSRWQELGLRGHFNLSFGEKVSAVTLARIDRNGKFSAALSTLYEETDRQSHPSLCPSIVTDFCSLRLPL